MGSFTSLASVVTNAGGEDDDDGVSDGSCLGQFLLDLSFPLLNTDLIPSSLSAWEFAFLPMILTQ